MSIAHNQQEIFIEMVWQYYREHGRYDLPWRQITAYGTIDPYHVLVSELMLQQTQVSRVIPKYQQFLGKFPTVRTLAQAELAIVLVAWQGLGYNRRAKFLWQTTQILDTVNYFPESREELVKLPGVGVNTAGAILAYAFNKPEAFIETNIRSVYIHHFYPDTAQVHDRDLITLVTETLDRENPREWYWALMDYGTHLKATAGNAARSSQHYTKQSRFEGSLRQVRGQVLRALGERPGTQAQLGELITDERLPAVLGSLEQEGLISRAGQTYQLG